MPLRHTRSEKIREKLGPGPSKCPLVAVCSDAFVLFSCPQVGRNLGKTPSLSQAWRERVAAQPGRLGAQSVSSSDPAARLQGRHMTGGPWGLSDPFPFPSEHQPSSGLRGYP